MDFFGWADPKEKTRAVPELSAAEREAVVPDVRRLLSNGKKIEAIMFVRERHPAMGLKEAKDFVDTIEQEMKSGLGSPSSGHDPVEDGLLAEEVRGLLSRGLKIEAVKVVREHRVMGLKEAKDYVDALERTMKRGR